MQRTIRFGMMAAVLVATAGCGVAQAPAFTAKPQAVGVRAKAQAVIGLKEAFKLATAHTQSAYGDDFRPVAAYADHILDKTGAAQPATWRFNMVGHLRGQAGYSLVKVQIRPDGSPFVDPKKGGPFVDHNNLNKWPQLDVANVLDPDGAAWQVVLNEGYARKYAPNNAVSWKLLPSDRLKRTVMTFNWSGFRANDPSKTVWLVDTSIDPMTGELVENAAFK